MDEVLKEGSLQGRSESAEGRALKMLDLGVSGKEQYLGRKRVDKKKKKTRKGHFEGGSFRQPCQTASEQYRRKMTTK